MHMCSAHESNCIVYKIILLKNMLLTVIEKSTLKRICKSIRDSKMYTSFPHMSKKIKFDALPTDLFYTNKNSVSDILF